MEWRRLIQGGRQQPDGTRASATLRRRLQLHGTQLTFRRSRQVAASVLAQNCPMAASPRRHRAGIAFPRQQHSDLHDFARTPPRCSTPAFSRRRLTGNQFIGGANDSPTNLKEEIVRIDHNFNSKFSVFGHFVAEQVSQGFGISQWSGDNVPTVGDTFGNPSYSASFTRPTPSARRCSTKSRSTTTATASTSFRFPAPA